MVNRKNKLGIAGFLFMLSGPVLLFLANVFYNVFRDFPELIADVISWICVVLPAIGAVLCIICLFSWKKINAWGRALSIVTVIMCNPFFYFFYYFICGMSSKTLAGLSWM